MNGALPDEVDPVLLLLRDLVHPFHTALFDAAWRTPRVLSLARTAYDTKDFTILPILADVLKEAGSTDAELLRHFRGEGPFVRGDWGLDLLLGKS